jgi:hypothetical protein
METIAFSICLRGVASQCHFKNRMLFLSPLGIFLIFELGEVDRIKFNDHVEICHSFMED